MNADFHWKPDTYVEQSRSIVPRFDELQAAAIAAIPFAPETALDLGIGTGETSRRLLDAFPDAKVTGLDSSPEMVFRARELGVEVKLARIEDPLPDGPWDLVIAALSIHHLSSDGKKDLFRRVREHARALVIADLVVADASVTPLRRHGFEFESAENLAEWCGGEVVWSADDLAVIRAEY